MTNKPLLYLCALALAGCSSSSSDDFVQDIDAVLAADAGSASEALADGKTLSSGSRLSSGYIRDHATESTAAGHNPKFTITKNEGGGVNVTLGTEISESFTPEDLNGDDYNYSWLKDEGGVYLFVGTWSTDGNEGEKPVEEVIAGLNTFADHHQVWSYYWELADAGQSGHGYAVVGTETEVAALEGKANATYSGYAVVDAEQKNSANFDRVRTRGDVTMSADFDAAKISGVIDNLNMQERVNGAWSDRVDVDGVADMLETDIVGNGFDGDLWFREGAGDIGTDIGSYSGKFFGEDGQEVGGTLSIENEDEVGSGFFSAKQDE